MELAELKKIIVEQRQEVDDFFRTALVVSRDVDMASMRRWLGAPNAVVISGVRRSGKSVLAHLLLRGHEYGYITFDDERLAGFTSQDFNQLLAAWYELYGADLHYVLLDEIQNIPHWELFVNRVRRTKRVVITGSNAKLLSGELATHLTGRYIDVTLYPFSFREFLRLKRIDAPSGKDLTRTTREIAVLRQQAEEYMIKGGFPEAHTVGKTILQKLYGDVLNKDIIIRHRVRHGKTMKELAKHLLSMFGSEITYTKLQHIFSVKNVHTVKNYVDYLSSSFLIHLLERFSYKLKEQAVAPKKVYGIDTGLIESVSFQSSRNTGRLMENMVCIELLRRSSFTGHAEEVYYWKDHRGREVDFVVKRGRKIVGLYQVCESLRDHAVRDRELGSLLRAGNELRCSRLFVITSEEDKEDRAQGKTVQYIPLWKWLLK